MDMSTRTPFPPNSLNQCGVPSGTRIKSPLDTVRVKPPSTPLPVRFVGFVRASLVSLPPVTSVPVPSIM